MFKSNRASVEYVAEVPSSNEPPRENCDSKEFMISGGHSRNDYSTALAQHVNSEDFEKIISTKRSKLNTSKRGSMTFTNDPNIYGTK
jgi:hypothetical protein